jgi:hypothetical protein
MLSTNVETVLGFAELRHLGRRPDLNSWVSQARQAFPAAARPLHDLIPASGPWPVFLDPAVADLEEGLAIVSATPRSQLRHELATTWHRAGHPPTWLTLSSAGPGRGCCAPCANPAALPGPPTAWGSACHPRPSTPPPCAVRIWSAPNDKAKASATPSPRSAARY